MADAFYVYLYRSIRGVPKYIGYGMNVERAQSHAGHSHNIKLREWLKRGEFELSLIGPYRDEVEGKNVEAALISAFQPEFNIAAGNGPKFVPVGVPPEMGDRLTLPALGLAELGRITGGALLVYLSPGDFLSDGRQKFDPANPKDEIIVADIRGYWDIGRHRDEWTSHPSLGPQALIGVHGKNLKYRFIAGASSYDTSHWYRPDLEVPKRRRWAVPLTTPVDLDAHELRGRRVDDVRFGQFSHQLHIWVDGDGTIRHPSTYSQ
jgi:hypothetical protein